MTIQNNEREKELREWADRYARENSPTASPKRRGYYIALGLANRCSVLAREPIANAMTLIHTVIEYVQKTGGGTKNPIKSYEQFERTVNKLLPKRAKDLARREGRHGHFTGADAMESLSVSDDLEEIDRKDLLGQLMCGLSAEDREAILLRIDGCTFAEIGRRCGISQSDAATRVYRAIRILKELAAQFKHKADLFE